MGWDYGPGKDRKTATPGGEWVKPHAGCLTHRRQAPQCLGDFWKDRKAGET